jgi:hypothetical protein
MILQFFLVLRNNVRGHAATFPTSIRGAVHAAGFATLELAGCWRASTQAGSREARLITNIA